MCGNINPHKYVEHTFASHFINSKKTNFHSIFIRGCTKNILKENEYKINKINNVYNKHNHIQTVNYRNILRYGLIVMMARRQTVHSYADARSHCV